MFNSSERVRRHQRQRASQYTSQCDSYVFFNLLTAPELFESVESLLPPHRERRFPPTEVLSMFLAQSVSEDRSCQQAVNASAVKRLIGLLPMCSTNTSGYCRARKRLPLKLVKTLAQQVGRQISERATEG